MGVLDDAIREHLDLKRRHGAAEEELRRQEAEALGPARREVAPTEADDGNGTGEQAPAEVEAAHQEALPDPDLGVDDEHPGEPELSEALPDDAMRSDPHATETAIYEVPPEMLEPEVPHEEPPAAGVEDEPPAEQPQSADTGFDEDEHEPPRAGDTPPQGFEALDDDFLDDEDEQEDEPAGHEQGSLDEDDEDASDEDADVLEDTPDFLQETPEHDRLWFEQKPPRDFDFD
jgi:hypothetical protein